MGTLMLLKRITVTTLAVYMSLCMPCRAKHGNQFFSASLKCFWRRFFRMDGRFVA